MPTYHKNSRGILLAFTALVGSLALSAAPASAEDRKYNFDLPAQPLEAALQDFARQAQQQVIFAKVDMRGITAPQLSGTYSADQALEVLLSGTEFEVSRTASGVLKIAAAADPQSVGAAGDGADGTVEALIVTAQKREEDIQDVPIAISAFTQEQLERSQVAGGPDLMTQVPNMTFTKTNFSSYSIQLRGIGTQAISATTDAAVAVAFNNTPFIRNRFFEQEFYDLQRVEVLRGPQGTLYGRNATAGVVNIISAKPTFGYEAKLSGDVANYNSTRLEGMLNIPLVEDRVALRIAGAWTKREGYTTNQLSSEPIDGRDLWSTRLSLRFTPTDSFDANLIWEHFEEDDDRLRSGKQVCARDVPTEIGGLDVPFTPMVQGSFSQGCHAASMYAPESFQAPNGFSLPYYHPLNGLTFPVVPNLDPYASTIQSPDLRVIESVLTPEYRAKADIVELQANVDLTDSLTLTSETAYGTDRVFSFQDYNRFNTREGAFQPFAADDDRFPEGLLSDDGVFCDPQLGCASRVVAGDVSTARSTQFSQEIRLGSNFDGPFNFSLGANFLRADTEDKYYVFINSLTLFAAMRGGPWQGYPERAGPWQPGVSDNSECLVPAGPVEPDPSRIARVGLCTYIDPNPIGGLNDLGHNYFLSKNPYKLISYAVFGESYYNITENLKVTAGLRWTVDKKEAPRIPSWVLASETVGYPVAEVSEQEWREPTGRLAIDWKPHLAFTEDTLLYVSYAHGYKAGGANPPQAGVVLINDDEDTQAVVRESLTIPRTFDPEFVDAYEIGSKNTFLDGRLTLNLAAFYYDYEGYQISYITDRSAVNLNFDAKIWGLELEADWRPLENLRLGLKTGYEDTSVADGERAVDVMDRTAGDPDWVVLRPHPARSSNCIVPTSAVTLGGVLNTMSNVFSGGLSGCEILWVLGDPTTLPGYAESNGGAGIAKDLSGNELPNAPHYTATLTADYTMPMPNDWLATIHTDLYYQSEAWTRIFNTEGYDKLKAYTNVNVAAIFTNEAAGWKVMAYVKNVFDRDSITGAFLNSDDTGLTTNVFLTEPRLYGLRVTKEFSGGPWWTGAKSGHTGPYPLTIELSGQVQRHDAPYETVAPSFAGEFADSINAIEQSQHNDLDWGDGRAIKLTYRPGSGPWTVSGALRYGRTNGSHSPVRLARDTESVCAFAGKYEFLCAYNPADFWDNGYYLHQTDWAFASSSTQEKHDIVDFAVGRDFALGTLSNSLSFGLRYAKFASQTKIHAEGTPDWELPAGWFAKYDSTHTVYEADLLSAREFEGYGPTLAWDGSQQVWGDEDAGRLAVVWSVGAGVLFGDQKVDISGDEISTFYRLHGLDTVAGFDNAVPLGDAIKVVTPKVVHISRSRDLTAPLVDLSFGLSYDVGRVKVGAGYRWERYLNVLDVGNDKAKDADRTIDGPYFKLSVGFGG